MQILLLPALLLALHTAWTQHAARELSAATQELRTTGEPVAPADLQQPATADDQNAALKLRAAGAKLVVESEAWQQMEEMEWTPGSRFPLSDNEAKILADVVAQNDASLSLIKQAAKLKRVDWNIDYTSEVSFADKKQFPPVQNLTQLLHAAAFLAQARGHDSEALAHVREMVFISDAIGSAPTLITYLLSSGIRASAAGIIDEIAPSLKIAENKAGAATPDDVTPMIAMLLDDGPIKTITVNGLRGERVYGQQLMGRIIRGEPVFGEPKRSSRWDLAMASLLRPVMYEDALIMLQSLTRAIEANSRAHDLPSFKSETGPDPRVAETTWWRHPFARILLPSIGRAVEVRFRIEADCRLAAAALAIRWYAVEHDGRLPEKLDDLVPKYLPSVPLDAIAGHGKTIGYVNDPDRPRIYHVGEDGKDDGGTPPDPNGACARQPRQW